MLWGGGSSEVPLSPRGDAFLGRGAGGSLTAGFPLLQVLQDMGLPTGAEGKESGKGDESAEETEQKPVVVPPPPPVVEAVSTPSAASPPADQSSEVGVRKGDDGVRWGGAWVWLGAAGGRRGGGALMVRRWVPWGGVGFRGVALGSVGWRWGLEGCGVRRGGLGSVGGGRLGCSCDAALACGRT